MARCDGHFIVCESHSYGEDVFIRIDAIQGVEYQGRNNDPMTTVTTDAQHFFVKDKVGDILAIANEYIDGIRLTEKISLRTRRGF